jgi:hypothetical protein
MSTVLTIPDTHQNIWWVKQILEREYDKVDHILFLGDLFDSHRTDVSTVTETAEYFLKLRNEESNLTILLGNHDAPYYSLYPNAKNFHGGLHNRNAFPCSGFTSNKCFDIAKVLTWDFIQQIKLAVQIDGVIYSHAGILPQFFPLRPEGYDIKSFFNQVDELTKDWWLHPNHYLLGCGRARCGYQDHGGLIWCDWNIEFRDSAGLPTQIFGHTKGNEVRQKGQNYCIDCKQTTYAIVTDGKPEFKTI